MVVWIEPWGQDFWMRHNDAITIEFDGAHFIEGMTHTNQPFDVYWDEDGMVVWVAAWDCSVRDQTGTELESGHQRPEDADRT
ncbi:hypothetical protein AB0H71_16250 [Nocardia sp. NPDC050697]|uniref:hypothetical protein n=1 Tax=Nocardia sp. NPDC050697 TaxID=3155158 RepID=UPI0033EDC7D7